MIWRTPQLLVDNDGYVIGFLAGRPQSEDWDKATQEAHQAFLEAGVRVTGHVHRRGHFRVTDAGISHGGGRVVRLSPYILLLIALLINIRCQEISCFENQMDKLLKKWLL